MRATIQSDNNATEGVLSQSSLWTWQSPNTFAAQPKNMTPLYAQTLTRWRLFKNGVEETQASAEEEQDEELLPDSRYPKELF